MEVANGALDELSDIVKSVLHQHPAINGTDILAASCNLITQIKGKSLSESSLKQCSSSAAILVHQNSIVNEIL